MTPGKLAELPGAKAKRDRQHEQRFEPAAFADTVDRAEFRAADPAGDRTQIGAHLGDGNLLARTGPTRHLACLSGRVDGYVSAAAHLDGLGVLGWLAGRSLEYLAGLFLSHGPRRSARLALRQVDQLDDVPANEVVLLGTPDRPGERALDLHQRRLAERPGGVPEEAVRVDGLEVLQLRCADRRVDPFLSRAPVAGYGGRVQFQ